MKGTAIARSDGCFFMEILQKCNVNVREVDSPPNRKSL